MILVCTANGVQKWRGEQESRTREIMLLKMLQSILAVISSAADRTRIQRSLSPFRGAKRVPCPFRVSLFPSSSPSFPYPVVFSPYLSLSLSSTLFVYSTFRCQRARDWARRKGIHFVSFDGDETQTRPYLSPSTPFSICMTLNLAADN